MSENNQPTEVANDRRRRINRLKKIIVITALILIIIPIVMCIFLMIKVSKLQNTVDELLQIRESQIMAEQQELSSPEQVLDDSDTQQEEETDEPVVDEPAVDDSTQGTVAITPEETVPSEDSEPEQVDTGKYVYLTFDDGPSSKTDKILQILDEHNVTATFFVIGKDDELSYARYKAIVDSGNTIGLHSYTHDYTNIYASVDNFASDLQRISDTVFNATGYRSYLYRFPGGSSNAIADDIYVFIDYLTANGYTYYDWNSSSRDAAAIMPPKEDIINTVVAEVEGKDNVVVLMHDSERKESTVEALPELIVKLKEMGYTIKGLDENSVPVQHR